jgi:hypothetical protein
MAIGSLAPSPIFQFLDQNGDPLAGAMLFTYLSGTSTPDPVFHDANLTVPWTNPAIADAGGFFISIYMGEVSQKWILQDQFGVVQWTVDPVASVSLTAGGGDALQVFEFGGDSVSPVSVTAYPTGASVQATHAGTSLMVIDPANIPAGTYGIRAVILEAGGATVSVALVDLLAGSPDVPLAVASGTSTTGASIVSGPITFPAGGVPHTFAIKTQTSAGAAFIWAIQLARI